MRIPERGVGFDIVVSGWMLNASIPPGSMG